MKLKTIVIAAFSLLLMLISTHSYGQIQDTIMFNSSPRFELGDQVKMPQSQLNQAFTFAGAPGTGKSVFVHISAAMAKKMQAPKGVKVSKGPVTLKRNGKCYTFGCDKSQCSDCKLYWKDRNGDGKVQPRRELRCFCAPKKPCKIRVRKSKC